MRKSLAKWFALGFLMGSSAAWADAEDTLSLRAGTGVMHDDNVFRAPDGRESSDDITHTAFGLVFDKQYSLQRFKVDAMLTDYRYEKNSYLDYVGKNLGAAWAWQVTPRLHGNLSYRRTEALNSYLDYVAASPDDRRNIRTNVTRRFDAEWEATPSIHLVGAVAHTELDNSQLFLQEDAFTSRTAEAGVKFINAEGNSVTCVGRDIDGKFDRDMNPTLLTDSGFKQTESECRFSMAVFGKSKVDGRLAYVDRKYDNFSERNFDGVVGNLALTWDMTAKTSLVFRVSRTMNPFIEARSALSSYSSYYESTNYYIGPVWSVTEKTRVSASVGREYRDYAGMVVNGMPLRDDVINTMKVSVDWSPRDFVNFNLGYSRLSRDSNRAFFDFSAHIVTLSAMFNF
jgi:exopolysaccharide biosynthesis operon protein EpsL